MIIKQNSDYVKSFVEADILNSGDDSKTFVQFVFPMTDEKVEFTFHGKFEREDFCEHLENIVNQLKGPNSNIDVTVKQ